MDNRYSGSQVDYPGSRRQTGCCCRNADTEGERPLGAEVGCNQDEGRMHGPQGGGAGLGRSSGAAVRLGHGKPGKVSMLMPGLQGSEE